MAKKTFLIGAVLIIFVVVFLSFDKNQTAFLSPFIPRYEPTPTPGPLTKYYFENLAAREHQGSQIKLIKTLDQSDILEGKVPDYTSWLFSFETEGQKVTGMLNLPEKCEREKCPVIIMFRGYADDEIYFTGLGTRKAAGVFAENGFITLAPDFLGFGGSDSAPGDVLEARFEKPITILNLLASLENFLPADENKVFFWAHSNGGQIALSVLEITKKPIPTTLWAPVTIGFPESILNYMDKYENLDELGKEVYNKVQKFCQEYNPEKVSIDNYFADITAPLQVQQGGTDYLVPQDWSDNFVEKMKALGKKINYFVYPKSDHNLKQDWDKAVQKDLEFFEAHL